MTAGQKAFVATGTAEGENQNVRLTDADVIRLIRQDEKYDNFSIRELSDDGALLEQPDGNGSRHFVTISKSEIQKMFDLQKEASITVKA